MKRNMITCASISRSYSASHSLQPTFRRHRLVLAIANAVRERPGDYRAMRVPVRFAFHHPAARHVCISGSFNDWNPSATPLVCLGGGRWLRLVWLPPGRHEYLFVADGVWVSDPHAIVRVPNVYGTTNSVVAVLAPSESTNGGCDRSRPRSSRRTHPAQADPGPGDLRPV